MDEPSSEEASDVEAARERQAWRDSPEYARAVRSTRIFLVSSPAAGAIGAILGFFYATTSSANGTLESPSKPTLIGAGIGIFFWAYLGWFLNLLQRKRARTEFHDRMLLGQARDELKQAEEEITGGSTDFGTLWAATQKRLDYYHKIATTQAERSFLYGQIAAGAGFVVIIIAALIAGFSRSTAAAIAAGVTGVSGGGLGAYIGSTFMKSQESAAAQLRAYFLQPLEFSKYLAAERLLPMVGEEGRSTAVNKIIGAILITSVDESADKA